MSPDTATVARDAKTHFETVMKHALRPETAQQPGEPRLLARGRVHRLGSSANEPLLSVVLPTKNGARHLRDLLPTLTRQRLNANLEIIAIDSGSEKGYSPAPYSCGDQLVGKLRFMFPSCCFSMGMLTPS